MFIQPYYHISVTKSFAEMPGTSGVVFGGRANFDILNAIARAYYADENFACAEDRSIDMWRVYNLFTGANKSSYIDTFLSRACNATTFTHGLTHALDGDEKYRWFVK